MAIDNLLAAILAMDAYNRGYSQAIAGLPDSGQVGDATIVADSTSSVPSSATDGFYGIEYSVNGQKVISYRGFDPYAGTAASIADVLHGFPVAIGVPYAAQAFDAVNFYKDVAGSGADLRTTGIELVGHSMGAGLAGFVGALYGQTGVLFDNMPFNDAAANAYADATIAYHYSGGENPPPGYYVQMLQEMYGGQQPWANNLNGLSAMAVSGEILQSLRSSSQTPTVQPINPYGTVASDDLHSEALLVSLLWVQSQGDTDWQKIGTPFLTAMFDDSLGSALGLSAPGTGLAVPSSQMLSMIGYSALTTGLVFGDTAIQAMFTDADMLGRLVNSGDIANYLQDQKVQTALADIMVEYAGLLAANHDTNPQNASGVFTYNADANEIVVDFTPSRWSLGSGGPVYIVGKQTLTDAVVQFGGGKPSSFEDATAKLWNGTTNITNLSNIIKLVADTTDDPGVTIDAAADAGITGQDTGTTKATDGAMLVAGGGKGDQLTGGVGNNLLVGGAGGDTLTAGTGVDLMFGGSGKDTFILGQGGTNWVDGGSGFNTAQYNTSDNLVETISSSNGYTTANADPIVMVVDSGQTTQNTGQTAKDYIVSMGDIKLGSGANTVTVNSLPFFPAGSGNTVTDLGATSTISGDVVDFSQYQGSVYLSSARPVAGAPAAVEVYKNKNFTPDTDAHLGFTDFNTLILGNGNNTLSLHTADDPYLKLVQAGNGNNVIKNSDIVNLTINLGTGNNIVGHVAKGTVVNLQSSDPASLVMSNDELINGSTPTDEIFTPGGILIKGAVGQVGSADPWIVGPDGTKYGFNQQGDLVIQDLLGDDTYISGYHGGPGVAFPDLTDGIFVGLSKGSAEKLLDLQRPFITYIDDIFKVGQDILYTKSGLKFFNVDPLVFDLTGQGINLTAMSTVSPMLDMLGTGFAVNTGWVEPNDGVLVLQQPGQDGTPNVTEMFGGPGVEGFAASRLKEHSRWLAN